MICTISDKDGAEINVGPSLWRTTRLCRRGFGDQLGGLMITLYVLDLV